MNPANTSAVAVNAMQNFAVSPSAKLILLIALGLVALTLNPVFGSALSMALHIIHGVVGLLGIF